NCTLSLKQVSNYTMESGIPRKIKLRFNIIPNWKAAGVNFRENCIFVDKRLLLSVNKKLCLVKSGRSCSCKSAYTKGCEYEYCWLYLSLWYHLFFKKSNL
ncbi:hypothetical protein CLU79DRAFT_706074, partial [Phycomyces nitens]